MTTFKNSTVLITGGASGIGFLMAQEVAGEGGCVVLLDINSEGLQRAKDELEKRGAAVFTYICDVSDKREVADTAEKVKAEAGKVDILINNAGTVAGKPFLECSDEEVEKTIGVNTMALFWTVRAFLPEMIKADHGHIVTISSAAGLMGVSKLADYSASKFAAFGFDESIRQELKQLRSKVRTTIVCPYFINTGMFKGVKTRFSFLLPILDEKKVAKKILRAVRKNRPRLFMPLLVYTVSPLRIFPTVLFDWVAGFLGINRSMDEFKGREG